MRKYKKLTIISFILVIFITSFLITTPQTNLNPIEDEWKVPTDSNGYNLDMYNESIEEGKYACQYINTNFSADLIDPNNCSREFQSGWLETYSWEKNHTYYDSMNVTQLDNVDDYVPDQGNFTIINGTMTWNDNLTDCDNVSTQFNSTEAYHYPATYSFREDADGSNPAGWTTSEGVSTTVQVIGYLDGHRKVVEMYDNDGAARCRIILDITSQTVLNIEFYYRSTDVAKSVDLLILDGVTYNSLYIHSIAGVVANTWHHIKFEVDTTCDVYSSWLDGIAKSVCVALPSDMEAITQIVFETHIITADYYVYLDAIGGSWDSDYYIGDNYHWQYYSSEPYDFEDDDLSSTGHYYGDPTSFTDDNCSESCIYYGGESDAFSFVGETGLIGTAIEFVDSVGATASSYQVIVSSSYAGHCEILNITSSNDGYVYARNNFAGQTTGTIEYWQSLPTGGVSGHTYIRGTGGTGDVTYPSLEEAGGGRIVIPYGDGAGGTTTYTDTTYTVGDWVHFKIIFDCSTDLFDAYVNGCLVVDAKNFTEDNDLTNVNNIRPQVGTSALECYWDAFGYSWDATYSTTKWDNCNPYGLPDEVTDFITSNYVIYPFSSLAIIDCLDGHKKVLELYQNNPCQRSSFYTTFSAQTSGTIEFWWRTNNVTGHMEIKFVDAGWNQAMVIYINVGQFGYQDGGGSHNLKAVTDDTWYHIRLDFESGDGGYMGLVTDTYDIYVDCVIEQADAAFRQATGDLRDVYFSPASNYVGLYEWFDAFGYSWETYTVSDNINPYGRPVDLSTFIDGSVMTCNASISIDGEFAVHKKILKLYDNTSPLYIEIYNSFTSNQEFGTIEFWIKTNNTNEKSQLIITQGSAGASWFYLQTNLFQYYDGAVKNIPNVGAPVAGVWHHIIWNFECGTSGYRGLGADQTSFTIDGIYSGVLDFAFAKAYIDRLYIQSGTTNDEYYTLYDAFQYSWDPDCDEFWNYETSGWVLTTGATADLNIIAQMGCHYNVLNISDKGGTPDPKLYQSLTEQAYGCISFNLNINPNFASTDTFIFELWDGASRGVSIQWRGGYILNHWESIGETYETDTWYNILVCFNCTTDNYTLYIDGFYIGEYEFDTAVDAIDKILLRTMYATDDEVYIDDIDYSWVESYACNNTIPDNFPELEFEINLCMDDLDYICYCLYWAFNTSSTYNMTFEWYNFNTGCWEILNYSIFNNSIVCNSICETFNYTALLPYVNGTCLKFRFYVYDYFSEFYFNLDQFHLRTWSYIHAWEVLNFDWIGIWEYHWILESYGVNYTASTTQFSVKDNCNPCCCNFQGISESDKTTKWVLMGSDIVGSYSEVYDEDFDDPVGRYWDLYGVSERYFVDFSNSYLIDNASAIDIVYTETHFDVNAQDTHPWGITWDGTYFWIVGQGNTDVYKYNTAGVFQSVQFDVGTEDIYPYGITWDGTHFWVVGADTAEVYKYTSAGVYTTTSFDTSVQDIYPLGITWDGTHFWVVGGWNDIIYQYTAAGVPTGTSFDTSGEDDDISDITWDGTHFWAVGHDNDEMYQYTAAGVYTGTSFDVGTEDGAAVGIIWDETYFWVVGTQFDEVYKYCYIYNISKNYHGAGYAYMQTNITETLNLRSQTFTDVTLTSGSYFTVNYTTTTNNEVNLLLYNDGGEVMDLTISVFAGTRTTEIYVDEDVTFDQLLISGVLGDTEYFEVFNISAHYLSTEAMEDITIMEIDPDGMDCRAMDFGDYELKIYELNGGTFILKDTRNITIPEPPSRLIEKYVPPTYHILKIYHYGHLASTVEIFGPQNETIHMEMGEIVEQRLIEGVYVVNWTNGENGVVTTYNIVLDYDQVLVLSTTYYNIFFTLSDSNLHIIDDSQYTFRLNGTIKEFGLVKDLETDDYNITVHDRFSVELFNQIITLRGLNEYRINISLYELQIRHLGYLNSNVSINTSYSFIMAPDSIRSFNFGNSTFNVSWVNGEDGVNRSYLINLTLDYVLTLNTTYYDIYFAKFAYDGYGFGSTDLVRFYINNERKDFGFNTLKYDTVNLKCLDYFNETLYDENVYLRDSTEWSIFIEIWTMYIKNNYSFDFTIKIERNNVEIEQFVLAQWEIEYRFTPNIEYEITTYYLNGTKIESKEIEFEENGQIISFGWYTAYVPSIPLDWAWNWFWILFFFVLFVFILIAVVVILWVRMKRIPNEQRYLLKKKKKNVRGFDHRNK